MDLNGKVEQLAQITAALKTEINELKGKDLSTKVNELEQETLGLKSDLKELKDILTKQNSKILDLINQQKQIVEETVLDANGLLSQNKCHRRYSPYSKRFPLSSLQDLDDMEACINEENSQEITNIVRRLLAPYGIVKNIDNVISLELIMECNVEGHHNKRRLLSQPKFMDVLFEAAHRNGYNKKLFLEDIRRGLKMAKNRYNKTLCRNRQIQAIAEYEHRKELEQQLDDADQINYFKTEQIFFDE